MVVREGLTHSWQKKQKVEEKGKIHPTDAEFQRIARRDKAFVSEQCKEMKGKKNKMGKTRYLFKKIR